MNKEDLKKMWNDAVNVALSSKNPFSNDHFEDWYSKNTIPENIQKASNFIKMCDSDIGFMGSPEYYEKKKIVEEYYLSIKTM